MNLLVSLGNLAVLVNPENRVLDLLGVYPRLMDTDVDGQFLSAGLFLESKDKFALVCWLDEADRLRSGAGDVVACFGQE